MEEPTANLDLSQSVWRGGPVDGAARLDVQVGEEARVAVDFAYAVVDGRAVSQGDMVLGPVETVRRLERDRKYGYLAFVTALGRPWPNGVIPWTSDPGCSRLVAQAIAHFRQFTPFRLVPHGGEAGFIQFVEGTGSESEVGCTGRAQQVTLADGATVGDAVHEICHALGLLHEHTRPDRDTYIQVLRANIEPSDLWMFDRLSAGEGDFRSPYDCDSIMHYPSRASAVGGRPSLLTRAGQVIGPRNGLSSGDIAALRSRYPGIGWR